VAFTAEDWPITAALLQYPSTKRDGTSMQDADAGEWAATFREVAEAGFTKVDLTDSWVRPGDLSVSRLDELKQAAQEAGVDAPAISAIRCSVIDPQHGEANLAYSHRTIEAAAHLGVEVVSFGLHQALTAEQKKQLWFWTIDGHKDPDGDVEAWGLAVKRLRELGAHASELGILVSLELYEDTFLGTGESALRLVQEIGLHNVGINPDVGNLVRLHRPIEDWSEILHGVLPYTNYWHVKNYLRDEDVARDQFVTVPSPLETGVINYRKAVRDAISVGFQGIICTEHYGGDGLTVSATNQTYLRNHVLPKHPGYARGKSLVAQSPRDLTNVTG
jgi:sugar phosphate isomerase/epimerase